MRRSVFDLSQKTLCRRDFLKGGLALAAGVATLGPSRLLADNRDTYTRWAFLSDTHIAADPDNHYRGFYPYRNLREISGQIAYNLPDGLVITGDLARLRGQTAAYENLKTLLAPVSEKRPVCLGVGNHDDRGDFFHAFGDSVDADAAVENKHVIASTVGPVRLIVLDSLLFVDSNPGLLGQPQRVWLQTFLDMSDETPTILFFHHTPRRDLLDGKRLFDIIGPAAKVKAVVYGHSHKYSFSRYQGIHLINLPATGYNMSGRQPVGWMEAWLNARSGEFLLHAIGGNRRMDRRAKKLYWRT